LNAFVPLPSGCRFGSPSTLVATVCGIGLAAHAPGTWASIATLPLGYGLHAVGGWPALLAGGLVALLAGLWAAAAIERYGVHDRPIVVIDEVAGQLLALIAAGGSLWGYAAGLFVFRTLDVLKPGLIGWADSRLPGAFGVMIDDVLAGVAAAAIVAVLLWVAGLP
jgi:phosphatidylglycerophosphatase A